MRSRKTAYLLVLAALCLNVINVFCQEQSAKTVLCPDTIYVERHCYRCDSINQTDARHKALLAKIDSLQPDSATAALFERYPPMLNLPKVYLGYRSLYHPEFKPNQFILASPAYLGITTPEWLSTAARADRMLGDIHYTYLINNPEKIKCAYSDLPQPIILPEEDTSFLGYLSKLDLNLSGTKISASETELDRINWLHYFNTGLQFSQAYISTNWYQGGNNYLALLFNFTWNVDLNTIYHPNLLFQSALNYKLGFNSNPGASIHKYSVSQDNFQYNLKAGFKAFNHWFYSASLQFKTPLFNTYPADSYSRTAGFLSPGTLNLGLGMTFTRENKSKSFKFSASVSPLSYNLKTCIISEIDHDQFNIKPGRNTNSEFGSNAEATMFWKISDTVTWTSRMFLFTDYTYFMADWENTFNFQFNRFLSTQLYLHPRFDSSSDFNASKWHYWMFKEILSIGLSFTFSTKPS